MSQQDKLQVWLKEWLGARYGRVIPGQPSLLDEPGNEVDVEPTPGGSGPEGHSSGGPAPSPATPGAQGGY